MADAPKQTKTTYSISNVPTEITSRLINFEENIKKKRESKQHFRELLQEADATTSKRIFILFWKGLLEILKEIIYLPEKTAREVYRINKTKKEELVIQITAMIIGTGIVAIVVIIVNYVINNFLNAK